MRINKKYQSGAKVGERKGTNSFHKRGRGMGPQGGTIPARMFLNKSILFKIHKRIFKV